jgi:hypothetical protein
MIEFVSTQSKGGALILVVEGCKTAWVDMSQCNGTPIRLITGVEDGEGFFKEVRGVFT